MRSDLIFGALAHVKNRYELCQMTSLATRKLHRTSIRVEDTTNDVLTRFRQADQAAHISFNVEESRAA